MTGTVSFVLKSVTAHARRNRQQSTKPSHLSNPTQVLNMFNIIVVQRKTFDRGKHAKHLPSEKALNDGLLLNVMAAYASSKCKDDKPIRGNTFRAAMDQQRRDQTAT
jgi:hypothetical protein